MQPGNSFAVLFMHDICQAPIKQSCWQENSIHAFDMLKVKCKPCDTCHLLFSHQLLTKAALRPVGCESRTFLNFVDYVSRKIDCTSDSAGDTHTETRKDDSLGSLDD